MLAFCRGNEDAFIQLYRGYRDRVVNHARRLLGDHAKAEEASQEVFLKLYLTRTTYEPRSRFSTFLLRIATNHCLNICARLENKLIASDFPVEEQLADNRLGPDSAIEHKKLRAALAHALARLPDKQRAALVLCHYEGLNYHDASEALGVSESSLKSLVHRARQGMIAQLGPYIAATPEVEYAM
jgi:RNA polymerase sigma-70 factor, ECF subfamily